MSLLEPKVEHEVVVEDVAAFGVAEVVAVVQAEMLEAQVLRNVEELAEPFAYPDVV